ncbi:MAG: hypothetical protein J6P44_01220 [Bacteroidales bacterium]|nr:hypothetical protein [Bacteroidales bacterium]
MKEIKMYIKELIQEHIKIDMYDKNDAIKYMNKIMDLLLKIPDCCELFNAAYLYDMSYRNFKIKESVINNAFDHMEEFKKTMCGNMNRQQEHILKIDMTYCKNIVKDALKDNIIYNY